MKDTQARHFRDELRSARARALADSEAYALPYHALERLGRYLHPKGKSLNDIAPHLEELAEASPLAGLCKEWPEFHRPFAALLSTARQARNDVMHIGARARHLTTHAIETCLVLEDALQQELRTIGDFMVPNPICVAWWQPLSIVRQRMLEHSFTYLPIEPSPSEQEWHLIADYQLATFLAGSTGRYDRLATTIEAARAEGLSTTRADLVDADTSIADALGLMDSRPLLVQARSRVVGIVTAFDLL